MKLLLLGLALLAGALAMLIFSNLNPSTLVIAGTVCTFLGAINLLSLLSGLGAGGSESDTTDAVNLVRLNNHSSGGGVDGFNDRV
jgi:hypothetical protein